MDTLGLLSTAWLVGIGGCGLVMLYWATRWWTGRMKAAELDELRAQVAAAAPANPQYNKVRALFSAARIEAAQSDAASKKGLSKGGGSDSDGGGDAGGGD
jgi:hypothetical protein